MIEHDMTELILQVYECRKPQHLSVCIRLGKNNVCQNRKEDYITIHFISYLCRATSVVEHLL